MPPVSELLARTLAAAGVECVFGLPGVHNIALWPALAEAGVTVIGARHEQGCAYAADGYARATGRLGVAIATTGPGAANMLGAVGEAWASKTPLLAICTDIPSTARRPGVYRGFLHECVDQPGMFGPVTKAALHAAGADEVLAAAQAAVELALTPPCGPVYLGLPTDVLRAQLEQEPATPAAPTAAAAPAQAIADAAALIDRASRPLIWVGGGGRAASAELRALAERLGAPVVTTFHGRGVLPAGHPQLVELPPHEPAVTALIGEADCALIVGSDLDQMMTQEWRLQLPAPRVALNVDAADAVKNYDMDLVLAGEAAATLAQLTPQLRPRTAWRNDLAALRPALLAELAASERTPVVADYLASLDAALPADAVVFADMAIVGYWASAYARVQRERGLHYPMGWGTLGFAMPAAIGAAAARRGPVVALCGDGGALFAIGELATVAQERLPLTTVIVDNGGYGALRYGHGYPPERAGTELRVPDFVAIAEGFGIAGRGVAGLGDAFCAALRDAVASGEPNVLVASAELPAPPTMSPCWPLRRDASPARAV